MQIITTYLTLAAALTLISCTPEDSNEGKKTVRVFAAASLTTVMPEIGQAFQKKHPDALLEFNFAASSMLAKQIEHGAAADIFISANRDWVESLVKKGRLQEKSRRDLIGNNLVLIVSTENEFTIVGLADLLQPKVRRIALADWAHVPAGIYSKQALQKAAMWSAISSKCIPALDVRAALAYVERGDVDCGLVYKTDAVMSKRVKIASELPDEIEPDIVYSMALTTNAQQPYVQSFFEFVQSPTASTIFRENGFRVFEYE